MSRSRRHLMRIHLIHTKIKTPLRGDCVSDGRRWPGLLSSLGLIMNFSLRMSMGCPRGYNFNNFNKGVNNFNNLMSLCEKWGVSGWAIPKEASGGEWGVQPPEPTPGGSPTPAQLRGVYPAPAPSPCCVCHSMDSLQHCPYAPALGGIAVQAISSNIVHWLKSSFTL